MNLRKSLIFLSLLLFVSCQKGKKTSEIKEDSKIENESQVANTESNSKINKNSNLDNNGQIFRDITQLEKYKGFTKILGSVLDGTDKAIAYIQKDSLQVLVLEQIIRDNPSKVKYKILDEVRLIADRSKLFSEPTTCKIIDGPDEKFVYGIAIDQDKEFFDINHLIKVWVVNLKEGRFKEIEAAKVECYNHWFGYKG